MALTDTAPETDRDGTASGPESPPAEPSGLDAVLGTGDHRVLGRVLVGFSLLFLVVDLAVAFLVLMDTAGDGVLDAALVARLGPNHFVGLLLCGILPLLLGIALVVVPAQVGSAGVAFPRAAAAAVWSWLLFSLILLVAVAADGSYGGADFDLARLGNVAVGGLLVSVVLLSICVVTTVIANRPEGLGLSDVPFFSFSMLLAGTIWILTLPSSFAHVVVGHITRAEPPALLESTYGDGISWLFRQPSVYAMAIPVLGLAIDAVAHLSGARPAQRGLQQTMLGLFALASFGAWAQTDAAVETGVWVVFAVVAPLPVLALFGLLLDTARRGSPQLVSPIAFVVLAEFLLLLGALAGVLAAIDTAGDGNLAGFDGPAMTSAQFYLVLGAALLGGLGALFYWGRLVAGDRLGEPTGKVVAPIGLVGAVLLGIPLLIVGVATPDDGVVRALSGIGSAGALILALAVAGTLAACLGALRRAARGDELLADPWGGGGTLEWSPDGDVPDPVAGPYPLWSDASSADEEEA